MREIVYSFIRLMTDVHEHLLMLNDAFEARLNDKDLHFLVFGVVGAGVFLGAWALFKWMRRHIGVVAWLFGFVVMLMLALSIEIGQYLTHTGSMELADIAAGMIGYTSFSLIVGVIFGSIGIVVKLLRRGRQDK